ncbi:outer membrane lipid asymmetry maintenance protein MlaD [Desulfothermus naphthae]
MGDKKYYIELTAGIFVFISLLCVGYLTIKLGKMELIGSKYYSIKARFSNITGLKTGNEVRISGVEVGRVKDIILNPKDFYVIVVMEIRKDIKLSDDSIASIKTNGLIGDKYISISPGGSDIYLSPGDIIVDTEPPVDFEELVSKYVFGNVKK